MVSPKRYRSFRRTVGQVAPSIVEATETLPERLGPHDVLVKIHAVSLNFRDIAILNGWYPMPTQEGGIVASDAAAEVVAIGSGVKDFAVGDPVSPVFDLNDLTGEEEVAPADLGGRVDGVLREYAVYDATQLVHLPKHLGWEEGATLTCAGVTAWNGLRIPPDAASKNLSILTEGTGGVSMFAVLLAIAAGVQPVITSSSDEKLANIEKLHPSVRGINYKTTPNVSAAARKFTKDQRGVDGVINTVGPSSIMNNLAALRSKNGFVSIIGSLDGFDANWKPAEIMGFLSKRAELRGVRVGSKLDFVRLNKFLEENKVSLTPLIDRVFPFSESKAAIDYLSAGKHVGKVVIKI